MDPNTPVTAEPAAPAATAASGRRRREHLPAKGWPLGGSACRDPEGRPRYLYAKDRAQAKQRLVEAQAVVHIGAAAAGPAPDASGATSRTGWRASAPPASSRGPWPTTSATCAAICSAAIWRTSHWPGSSRRTSPALRREADLGPQLDVGAPPPRLDPCGAPAGGGRRRARAQRGRPRRSVESPKVRRVEMTTIADGDQPRRFLEAAKGERLEALLVLAITTGMRRGELLALRWKDVDLDRGVLAVTGALQGESRATLSIASPKSASLDRSLWGPSR